MNAMKNALGYNCKPMAKGQITRKARQAAEMFRICGNITVGQAVCDDLMWEFYTDADFAQILQLTRSICENQVQA